MKELKESELREVNGGVAISVAIAAWTILICGKDQLTAIGKDIGNGLYDGLHG
ncbi:class IIb bacteriocin, lactobin A/cerein 7B family [Thalassotalea fusca]